MPEARPVIVWFRQDLRLADNPALEAAVNMGAPIVPIYILDDVNAGEHALGAASRWWLHHSLHALNESLGGGLLTLKGDAAVLLPELAHEVHAAGVFWNRCYEPWRIQRDKRIKASLLKDSYLVRSFNGSLLFEPPHITKRDGSAYRVFTPYFRRGCLDNGPEPRKSIGRPAEFNVFSAARTDTIDDLGLLPQIGWYEEIAKVWKPGEHGARERVDEFLVSGIRSYRENRDRPDRCGVSRLSPHLHFGEVSPHMVWHAVKKLEDSADIGDDVDRFLTQLAWREFSHYLLYYWPELPNTNVQRRFDGFPWRRDATMLERWRTGQTGYPIVDAGMRQLWLTGYMHNRVRMIVGSFLVEKPDARLATGGCVVLGYSGRRGSRQQQRELAVDRRQRGRCGAVFSYLQSVTQGKKFDPDGDYVRHYIPEIAGLASPNIHSPWDAPESVLRDAGVTLGDNYPHPIVDLKSSRQQALEAFRLLQPRRGAGDVANVEPTIMTPTRDSKLREMLIGYAAAHQHPFNIAVHLIGIPVIMLGVSIPMSLLSIDVGPIELTGAHAATFALFLFYLTLDVLFASSFLVIGLVIAHIAMQIAALPTTTSMSIAALAFFGGYALQFVGHAVERSHACSRASPDPSQPGRTLFHRRGNFRARRAPAGLVYRHPQGSGRTARGGVGRALGPGSCAKPRKTVQTDRFRFRFCDTRTNKREIAASSPSSRGFCGNPLLESGHGTAQERRDTKDLGSGVLAARNHWLHRRRDTS